MGVGVCSFKTMELEYEQANEQLGTHMKFAHNEGVGQYSNEKNKPEKFPRPSLEADSTTEAWEDFEATWAQYKEEYNLSGKGLIRQLHACCSTELKTSLSRITCGKQFEQTEPSLMKLMKQLAVRHQNPAVHVQEFLGLTQQADEGVRHYLTRLRGVAGRCDFNVDCQTCNKAISYQDNVVRFKLIQGLTDQEIKEHILSEEDKSLDDTVKAIEAKESGKTARKAIGVTTSPTKVNLVGDGSSHKRCNCCGRLGHNSDRLSREKECPAYGKKCLRCGKQDHFKMVCKSKSMPKKTEVTEVSREDAADVETITTMDAGALTITSGASDSGLALGEAAGLLYCMGKIDREVSAIGKQKVPHMLYEQLKWVIKSPPTHPTCSLSVSVSSSGYKANGLKPPSAYKRRDTELSALADTGCQAVCMGRVQLQSLGLSVRDLLTPMLNLKAANSTGITVLGAVFIYISGVDSRGKVWGTHQICYVAEGLDRMLLSRQACEELGMISSSFPTVGCHSTDNRTTAQVGEVEAADILPQSEFDLIPCSPDEEGACQCPRREPTPPPPEFSPGKTAAELREIIIKHYAASAFNRCTRQKLPMMKGEPLPIPTKVGAKPIAYNKHVPVPRHTLGQKGGQDFRERHEKVKYVPKNMVFQFLETFGDEIFCWAL